jgi:hypothetical protein
MGMQMISRLGSDWAADSQHDPDRSPWAPARPNECQLSAARNSRYDRKRPLRSPWIVHAATAMGLVDPEGGERRTFLGYSLRT